MRFSNHIVTALQAVTLIWVAACNYRQDKPQNNPMQGPATGQNTISFAQINDVIIKPSCLSCHANNHTPILLSYSEVKASLGAIQREVLEKKTMPKSGPLPAVELALLQKWISEGAEEFVNVPMPSPTPTPHSGFEERPLVKWDFLREKLLKPKCLGCHYQQNLEKISNLDDLDSFRATIGTIFFLSVPNPTMPPPPKGTPEGALNPNELNRAEKDLLSHWIVDGMLP